MSKSSSVMGAFVVAAVVLLSLPAGAAAHGLAGGYDPSRPVLEYVWLGFWHMLAGWDHLLFIAGVVLLAGSVRDAAKLISLFVAGHSLTLIVATLGGWGLDATLVDAVIALSLVYVGVTGWRGRPGDLRPVGAVVFAFGLVHGLGLATRLADLGLPEDGVLVRVILFNVGVEIGQLTALGLMAGLGMLVARRLTWSARTLHTAFGALALTGLLAAAVVSFPSEEASESSQATRRGSCTEQAASPPPLTARAAHPAKTFYEPGESAPEADLDHVRGDGFVIVRYRPDLPAGQLSALRRMASGARPRYVIVAPAPRQQAAVRALTARSQLNCRELESSALTDFRDNWLASLR